MDRPSGSRAFVLGLSFVTMVVACEAAGDPDSPALNADGAFVVCDADPWPMDLQVEDAP